MDRRTLLEHLTRAERDIRDGERYLVGQRALIEMRRRDGHDVTEAMKLLAAMEAAQRQHRKELAAMREQLAAEEMSNA
jgi:hypothetical protein